MGAKNFTFSRLNKPPIPGKSGLDKVKLSMLGVISLTGPNNDGMYAIRAKERIHHADENLSSIAAPGTDVAFYISTTGAHSVVFYQDLFWAVMAVKRKYIPSIIDSTVGPIECSELLYQDIILVKPGTSFKHSIKGARESATWPGLPKKSEEFIRGCIEELAFK